MPPRTHFPAKTSKLSRHAGGRSRLPTAPSGYPSTTTKQDTNSAIEHSDAVALFGYVSDWNEVGPRIESGPSDSHVDVVLMHSAEVMATVLDYICRYWGIERPDIFAEASKLFSAFASESAGSSPTAS